MDILRAGKNTNTQENQISTHDILAELADKYGDSVYKFCRSLTYSKDDADDLFQETFLKIFEQPLKINGSGNPQSFLFSTALYIWKTWRRKYARRNRIAPVELLDYEDSRDNIAGQINIEEEFTLQEEIQAVKNLVENLPEKLKIPVILYYTMETDVSEIALTLRIPEGTVKSRLFNARKIIEKGLIEFGFEQQ
ncbi:MAG: RNA polymerase sigma factor [Oscillospiraceae bacterium]|nr:RNA polymerase sigma factor [Oscillospiraceae bacterium]